MFVISWLVSMHFSGFDASFSTHSCSIWGTSTPNDGLVYYQETSVNCVNSKMYSFLEFELSGLSQLIAWVAIHVPAFIKTTTTNKKKTWTSGTVFHHHRHSTNMLCYTHCSAKQLTICCEECKQVDMTLTLFRLVGTTYKVVNKFDTRMKGLRGATGGV